MSLLLSFTNSVFFPFLSAFFISLFTTILVIRFAKRWGILDYPEGRGHPAKLHTRPVPRGGGIPIFASLCISALLFLPTEPATFAIIIGSSIILFIGVLDDRKEISPLVRLVFNVLASLVIVISGVVINFFTNPFGGILNLEGNLLLPILVTVFWLVFMTNSVSWSSGIDGQLAGFVPIAAATIGALSLRFGQDDYEQLPVIILSVIIAGSYLGLLTFSRYPQRIMPGYSGGALAGFLLGVLSILSGAKLATMIIVLGLPFMDALFVIGRRIIQRRSPLIADSSHFHHRLLAIGLTKSQVAIIYWLISGFLGFLVLHLNSQVKFYTILMLAALVGGALVWLQSLRSSNRHDRHTG